MVVAAGRGEEVFFEGVGGGEEWQEDGGWDLEGVCQGVVYGVDGFGGGVGDIGDGFHLFFAFGEDGDGTFVDCGHFGWVACVERHGGVVLEFGEVVVRKDGVVGILDRFVFRTT